MKRLVVIASVLLLAATAPKAAPPDFWYVVPEEAPPSEASRLVRGIVVPSTVTPTVQTTPGGSVISWSRPDGTRQSFAVQGVSSFRFEPGPLEGTTYVPFGRRKHLQFTEDSCCECASWQNSQESVEALSCVVGCIGCGCEGCICSPSYPCPVAAPGDMILSAHIGSGSTMRFGKLGTAEGITLDSHDGAPVSFRGKRVAARVTSKGETVIDNPDSVTLPGTVATSASIRGDTALFAWSSPDAGIILEQPRSMPPPSFHDGVIDFNSRPAAAPATTTRGRRIEPVMDRCRICGTHPDSEADLDIYACVPGWGHCWRCIDFACFAAES